MKQTSRSVRAMTLATAIVAVAVSPGSASAISRDSAGPSQPRVVSALVQVAANDVNRHGGVHMAPMQLHMAPMRVMPREHYTRPPVVRVPRAMRRAYRHAYAPRFRPYRAHAPRIEANRPMIAPAPRVTAPMHAVGVPPANFTAVRHASFTPGVPVPQLRRGAPFIGAGLPQPNLASIHPVHLPRTPTVNAPGVPPANRRPITGLVSVHHQRVAVYRGQRYIQYNGRWHRIRPITAIALPFAFIAVGGASYYADGYLDTPAPACGGVTDAGCQLKTVNVDTDDGETVPQCVQYCPWDSAQAAATSAPAAESSARADYEPITRVGGTPVPALTIAPPPAGAPPPATTRVYAIRLQSAPAAGGKCATVPSGSAVQGATLQAVACEETASQTFAYDAGKKTLAAGSLCVAAVSGAAPGQPLHLGPCNGSPNQTWYIRQNGDYVEFVGIDGLCMETGAQDGTPLIGATCQGQPSQSWTMHAAQPSTTEAAK